MLFGNFGIGFQKNTFAFAAFFGGRNGREEIFDSAKKIINIDVEELEKKVSLWLGKLFKKFRIYALKLENLSARLSIKFHERSKTLSESRKEYWEQFKNGEQAENKQEK